MPNGKTIDHKYNDKWCEERHEKLDHRIDRLEKSVLWILGLLITQIISSSGAIITFLMTFN